MLYLAGRQEDVLFEIIIQYIRIFDLTTAICRLIGGFCWYIVYLKGVWYFVQAWLFFARRLRCDCCCTVDLLEAGSLHAALTRYLIFLQLLPLKMMMHTFGLSCTVSQFFVEMQAVVVARGVYMFDLSGTSVFKMRGPYI